jgi:uncharacterized protein DUF4282
MTRPTDPGQPYGPPPPRRPGGAGQPPPPARPGGPSGPPPGWDYQNYGDQVDAGPPAPAKGFMGSLFDLNFNHLVTPRLIKLLYVLLLLVITLWNLGQLMFGLYVTTWDDMHGFGPIIIIATPVMWLIEIILWRIILEAVIVRFKGVEYLRIMKDKDGMR